MLGWKEFELEVMRDRADNVVIICSIENFDPMGIHTGDSHHRRAGPDPDRQGIPDHARRRHRRSSARSASRPAAPTSSSPSTPRTGAMVIIEMNPRVSRSSALASKATGLSHRQDRRQARRRLHARRNPQRHHPQDAGLLSSRPSTTWWSRCRAWPSRNSRATTTDSRTQMKSVGEAMAIGRTFKEALQKALRSLEERLVRLPLPGQCRIDPFTRPSLMDDVR